ncbi:hypothetical protein [Prevotella sp. E2-28]|uniref:hypothetical protein n=1 Tax=Prevotella sp. E2-28 TaxID=2913620 RepID=UPI001EDBC7A6|nr:hypothetical protein [Prevotella sp. E2-28]UKK52658.1 hypothetical protein L6465_08570 [Prevotella sp. E2-28]
MKYAGTDLKYKVTSTVEYLVLSDNDFTIAIKNRWGKVLYEIAKEDCFVDSDGNYYFTMENVPSGVFYAYFSGSIDDNDYEKSSRNVTDVQHLITIGGCDCKNYNNFGCCDSNIIQYEQVWTVNIDGEEYLCDRDGNAICTSDGNKIQFVRSNGNVVLDMTGDEFKELVEGRNQDDKIDTIPEAMDALNDVEPTSSVEDMWNN